MTTKTATKASAPKTELHQLSPKLIDPDPENRPVTLNADFKKSIAEHGVLEAINVAPHPDKNGRYILISGERRWRAATAAGLTTIPAVVRTGLTEAQRIVLQWTENEHRQDLTPCQEGHQFMRLAKLGHTVKQLAGDLNRSQKLVRDRLKLIELPKSAQKLIDSGEWSVADGLEATKLLDFPDALSQLIDGKPRNVEYTVRQFLADYERAVAKEQLTEKAIKAGHTIIEDPKACTRLDDLGICLLYTSPSPRDATLSRMPSSA